MRLDLLEDTIEKARLSRIVGSPRANKNGPGQCDSGKGDRKSSRLTKNIPFVIHSVACCAAWLNSAILRCCFRPGPTPVRRKALLSSSLASFGEWISKGRTTAASCNRTRWFTLVCLERNETVNSVEARSCGFKAIHRNKPESLLMSRKVTHVVFLGTKGKRPVQRDRCL